MLYNLSAGEKILDKFEIQSRLVSCPFCKYEYPLVRSTWIDFHRLVWIECPKCHSRTMKHFICDDSIENLVSLWNNSGEVAKKSKRVSFLLLFLPLSVVTLLKRFFNNIECTIKYMLGGHNEMG